MNHTPDDAKTGDVTGDYYTCTLDDLREHLQALSDYLTSKRAAAQGMRLATA